MAEHLQICQLAQEHALQHALNCCLNCQFTLSIQEAGGVNTSCDMLSHAWLPGATVISSLLQKTLVRCHHGRPQRVSDNVAALVTDTRGVSHSEDALGVGTWVTRRQWWSPNLTEAALHLHLPAFSTDQKVEERNIWTRQAS